MPKIRVKVSKSLQDGNPRHHSHQKFYFSDPSHVQLMLNCCTIRMRIVLRLTLGCWHHWLMDSVVRPICWLGCPLRPGWRWTWERWSGGLERFREVSLRTFKSLISIRRQEKNIFFTLFARLALHVVALSLTTQVRRSGWARLLVLWNVKAKGKRNAFWNYEFNGFDSPKQFPQKNCFLHDYRRLFIMPNVISRSGASSSSFFSRKFDSSGDGDCRRD